MWHLSATLGFSSGKVHHARLAFVIMEDPGDLAQAQQSAERENTGSVGAPYSEDFYIYSFKVITASILFATNCFRRAGRPG
jgi:hypothetical protein